MVRIEDLEAREEIRELRNAYHHFVNSGYYDRVSGLFVPDAIVDLGYFGRYQGKPEIHDGYLAMGERTEFLIKQYVSSHAITIQSGDRHARGHAYLDARYARGGTSYLVSGRYDDEYIRTSKGWKFSQMKFEVFFTVPLAVGWATEELHYLHPDHRAW